MDINEILEYQKKHPRENECIVQYANLPAKLRFTNFDLQKVLDFAKVNNCEKVKVSLFIDNYDVVFRCYVLRMFSGDVEEEIQDN